MNTFDYGKVKDPQYFCDGRLMAHSDHRFFASEQDAEAGFESFKESLNGLWKFHYARNYEAAVPGFEKEDYCCRSWDDIHVPAHIQMEGYDVPQYANVQYPWEGHDEIHPGEIPEYFNPVASYVKYFTVPERMKGERLFISFQGAESGLALWLNGRFVGYSEDSFTPSEFELTEYVKDGENKLAAQVFKWTSSSWCEDQDFYRFSGIFRDVYLYTTPKVHVRDLKVETLLSDDYGEGTLLVTLDIADGRESADRAGYVGFSLYGPGGGFGREGLEDDLCVLMEKDVLAEGENKYSFSLREPKLWSAEVPDLYRLLIQVYDENLALQEAFARTLGTRSCIALHRAVEYCRIPDVFDFHNAFYDVLYSALVSEYSTAESLRLSVHRDAPCTEDHILPLGRYGPFANKEEALNDRRCRTSRCLRCNRRLWVMKWVMTGDVAYAKVGCASHGTFLAKLSFSHTRRRLWVQVQVQELTMGNRMRWRAAKRKKSFLCTPQRRPRQWKRQRSAGTVAAEQK